uniref:Ubiquitin conjugating enzyme E2 S n=1 Tax=Sarcophilus harrisii TaxID=9305 RepID=A0A7N4PBH4_SARHA
MNSNVENLPPHIIRLVYKEVTTLTSDPPDGIKVFPNEEDVTDLQVTIEGPGEPRSAPAARPRPPPGSQVSSLSARGHPLRGRPVPHEAAPGQGFPGSPPKGLLPHQNLPPQRGGQRGDLRQRAQERLDRRAGHPPCAADYQVPSDPPEPRVGAERGGRPPASGGLRGVRGPGQAADGDPWRGRGPWGPEGSPGGPRRGRGWPGGGWGLLLLPTRPWG